MRILKLSVLVALVAAGCSGKDGNNDDDWELIEVVDVADVGDDASSEPDVAPQPDVDPTPQPPRGHGEPCTDDDDCLGTCATTWPEGYCTQIGCEAASCGEGATCLAQRGADSFCAADCVTDDDCREGYACGTFGRFNDPNRPRMCTPITGAADGEACEGRRDCQSGMCLDWPGGYCTTYGCRSSDECSNIGGVENVCLSAGGGFTLCVRSCETAADCRENYLCEDIGGGESVCVEDPSQPFDEAVFVDNPLNIQCGLTPSNGSLTLDYTISPDAISYMVTPLTRDGAPLDPRRLVMPDGVNKNFTGSRQIFLYPASFLASMNPTLVPMAPAFDDMFQTGANQYLLRTDAAEVCYYTLEKTAPGTTLDLNVYIVDVNGVTAATAGEDANFTEVLDEVARIYGQVGVEVGQHRFYDVSADDAARFGVLRSETEVPELLKRSVRPGDDLASVLSVNVFFVGEFAMRGTIGISYGLPGPAGLHGTHGSGVVFTAEYMGRSIEDALGDSTNGNKYTALLLAHEVGHWLGLFHTTEQGGQMHDPLTDTPQCNNPNRADDCPDWGNLMFPFAGAGNVQMSEQQGYTLKMNPVTQPAEGEVR